MVLAFIFAMLSGFDANSSEVAKSAAPVPDLGRTYSQLMDGMGAFFPLMEPSKLASGEFRRMGKSDQKKAFAIYDVIGGMNSAPVSRASLSFFATDEDSEKNLGAAVAMGYFVRNVFPEWPEGPAVVMKHLVALADLKPKPNEAQHGQIYRNDKTIELSFTRELGMFTATIKPTKNSLPPPY
jgi:hypothetical protein